MEGSVSDLLIHQSSIQPASIGESGTVEGIVLGIILHTHPLTHRKWRSYKSSSCHHHDGHFPGRRDTYR